MKSASGFNDEGNSKSKKKIDGQRIIKKYQNRRLYDTYDSVYITITEVKDLVMASINFIVVDAKTNNDITRQILLSILLEEETCGAPLFSNQLLRQMISFYGNTMQTAFGRYLEGNIRGFIDAQKEWHNKMEGFVKTSKVPDPMAKMMDMQSPNLFGAYFENGKKMFDMMQNSFNSMGNMGTNPWGTPNTEEEEKSTESVKPKTRKARKSK